MDPRTHINGYIDLLRSLVCTTTAQHVNNCYMCGYRGNFIIPCMDTVSKLNPAHQHLDFHQVREYLASLLSSLAVVSSSINQLTK